MKLRAAAQPFALTFLKGREAGITIPEMLSAEIGNVDDAKVVTVWDNAITEAPSVIIEVDDAAQVIASTEIQVDTTVVYYVIPVPANGSLAVITINGIPVTNNIAWFPGTGTITQSGNNIVGVGTLFLSEISIGDLITGAGISGVVTGITNDSHMALDSSATVAVGVTFTVTP